MPLISLLTANAVSMVGNALAMVAIPWFVLETSGSAARTGVVGFFTILPVVLAGFLGGALIDRLGYRRTSILADLASAASVALIPWLHVTRGLQFWQLIVLVFVGALLDAPGGTARSALIPDLAARAGLPIERATSAAQVIERASRLAGAPLAGVLIGALGSVNVLWIDAASFLLSAALVAAGVAAAPARSTTGRQPYLGELKAGLGFLRTDRVIVTLVIVVMLTNFLDAALSGVILPVYVKQVFGSPINLGLILAINAGGAVLGAVAYGVVGHRLPRRGTFVAMFVFASLQLWAFALHLPLGALLTVVFVCSAGAGPLNPIIDAVAYEHIPAGMRGRVLGTITAGAWLAMPLGVLLGGVLTDQLGVGPLLVMLALAYLATTLSMAALPALRGMERPALAPSPS
jgi:MFS family permease